MPRSGRPKCWWRKPARSPVAEAQADLRATVRALFDRAVQAADPAGALARQLNSVPLPRPDEGGRTLLIAVGKAAPAMISEALQHVAGPVRAICVTYHENEATLPDSVEMHRTGHPVPDAAGLAAGQSVIDALNAAGRNDQVIALISGGGSALLPAPAPGLTLEDKIAVNRLLLESGLDITQMNLVRQHLSQLKGGGMVRLALPAPVTAYILSDVIGDDLRAIASGPTVGPIGTPREAAEVLHNAGVWERLPNAVRTHLETTPAPPETPQVVNRLIGSNRHSLKAMAALAAQSMSARVISHRLTGDVAQAAQIILDAGCQAPNRKTQALLFGGETTVRLVGDGLGGRNQELALRVAIGATARNMPPGWVFLSGGTDGRDGPTDAAGGIVDAGTFRRIADAGGDAETLLANNDSNRALRLAGDLLLTGPTGTNVADVQVLLIPASSAT